jgi:hypothetical protein
VTWSVQCNLRAMGKDASQGEKSLVQAWGREERRLGVLGVGGVSSAARL